MHGYSNIAPVKGLLEIRGRESQNTNPSSEWSQWLRLYIADPYPLQQVFVSAQFSHSQVSGVLTKNTQFIQFVKPITFPNAVDTLTRSVFYINDRSIMITPIDQQVDGKVFGKAFSFTPQALAYDWVGGAVYASGCTQDRLIVGRTSPAGECDIVYNKSLSREPFNEAWGPVHSMAIDPYRGDMFFILTCGTSKCLIRADHVEGGPTVKMNVGTAMAVNVVTGCLFTVQQSTGAIIQIPYYTGSSCPDMKYNNPFPNDYSINREHITAHSVQLQDSFPTHWLSMSKVCM